MSKFLRKTILFRSSYLDILRNHNVCSLRWFSSSPDEEHSFTVSYLVDSLGISPESALSASKLVALETSENPDKVIRVFKGYGFTQTQISTLVKRYPKILLSNTERTIVPKLEFFKAKGMSGHDMAKILSVYPDILRTSLENKIIPSYDFLWNLSQSDKKTITIIKRYPVMLEHKLNYVVPNIEILREYGVPDSNISYLIHSQPRSFIVCSDRYRKIVEEVVVMGFDASQMNFVLAVFAFVAMCKSTWQSKVDAYKKWGLSEEEVLKAFRKNPWCMMLSEGKIMAGMNFFVKEMGWRPSIIAERSLVLGLSLKKRIIPRCSVLKFLLSKCLVKEEVKPGTLLLKSEEKFLKKFVTPFEKAAPELLKLYKEKLAL